MYISTTHACTHNTGNNINACTHNTGKNINRSGHRLWVHQISFTCIHVHLRHKPEEKSRSAALAAMSCFMVGTAVQGRELRDDAARVGYACDRPIRSVGTHNSTHGQIHTHARIYTLLSTHTNTHICTTNAHTHIHS